MGDETMVVGAGWTMYRGDCLEVMATMPDRSVGHVITDPPYEAEAHTKQRRVCRGSGNRNAVVEPLDFEPIGAEERVACAADLARIAVRWSIVFCQAEASMLWQNALVAGGAVKRRLGVWIKPDGMPQLTGDRPGMGYESIVFAHTKGRSRWNGGGRVGVFFHNKNGSVGNGGSGGPPDHPTTKPVPLMLELVDLFTDHGETILDPFAGSATTGVAAIRRGRTFIGIEKDPKYFDLCVDRLRAEESGHTLAAERAGQLTLLPKVAT